MKFPANLILNSTNYIYKYCKGFLQIVSVSHNHETFPQQKLSFPVYGSYT